MRATVQNYIAAAKARREENGEKGFSLIELIVVVAILGILVAVAIPVFNNIQQTAKVNAANTVAANAVSAAAAVIANGGTPAVTDVSSLVNGKTTQIELFGSTSIDTLCATATVDGVTGAAGKGSTLANGTTTGACTGTATVTAPAAP